VWEHLCPVGMVARFGKVGWCVGGSAYPTPIRVQTGGWWTHAALFIVHPTHTDHWPLMQELCGPALDIAGLLPCQGKHFLFQRSVAVSDGLGLLCLPPEPIPVHLFPNPSFSPDVMSQDSKTNRSCFDKPYTVEECKAEFRNVVRTFAQRTAWSVLRVSSDGSTVQPVLSFHMEHRRQNVCLFQPISSAFLGTASSEMVVTGKRVWMGYPEVDGYLCLPAYVRMPADVYRRHVPCIEVVDVATGVQIKHTFPWLLTTEEPYCTRDARDVVSGQTGDVIAITVHLYENSAPSRSIVYVLSRTKAEPKTWRMLFHLPDTSYPFENKIQFCDNDTRAFVTSTIPRRAVGTETGINLLQAEGDMHPRIKSVGELRIMDVRTACTLRRVTMWPTTWPHGTSWVLYGTYCVVMRPDDWTLTAWDSEGVRHSFFNDQSCEFRPNMLLPGGGGLAILINDRGDDEHVFKSYPCPGLVPGPVLGPHGVWSIHPVLVRPLWLNPMKGVRGAWMSAVARAARARFEAWRQALLARTQGITHLDADVQHSKKRR
jgi:hypothetical protein